MSIQKKQPRVAVGVLGAVAMGMVALATDAVNGRRVPL
jgi:hypothetical protein